MPAQFGNARQRETYQNRENNSRRYTSGDSYRPQPEPINPSIWIVPVVVILCLLWMFLDRQQKGK